MSEMTTQQKAEALNALSVLEITMYDVMWRARLRHVDKKRGTILGGGLPLAYATPWEAVEACWDHYVTELEADEVLVLHAESPERRRDVRWNGFMWQDILK